VPKVKGLKELTLLVKQQKVKADMTDKNSFLEVFCHVCLFLPALFPYNCIILKRYVYNSIP
jgi:hypothetical protein